MTTLAEPIAATASRTPATRLVTFDGCRGEWFERLAKLLEPQHGLRHREFVDYFYGSGQWCKLSLLVSQTDEVLGVLGYECVPFDVPGRKITLGFGSNFRAFQSGAGGILFLNWLKQCDYGLIFGGSPDTHKLLDPRRWTTYPGVAQFELNASFSDSPSDVWWKKTAKWLLEHSPANRRLDRLQALDAQGGDDIHVEEVACFTNDMLPQISPFAFRFNPSCEYLNWRFNTELSFAKYRIWRIERGQQTAGYVVLNEQRHRVLVAQADADDELTLARGIVAAIRASSQGRRRRQGVVVTAANETLKTVLRTLGFKERVGARPFVIGSLLRKPNWPEDTSRWNVNFDWCDNGLRPPFWRGDD